jgi:predicted O-methyltransferase YrrM
LLQYGIKYLRYLFTSVGPHGLHSPFVYNLATKLLADKSKYAAYTAVEKLRKQLVRNTTPVAITDYGAGAGNNGQKNYSRTVGQIARTSAKPPKLAKLLYRLCAQYQPQYMLELGTSLGISGSYQALGALQNHQSIQFITLDGSEAVAGVARQNFAALGLGNNVQVGVGNFDEILPLYLKQFLQLDYVFFDGNHRYQPTINYFNQCLPLAHEGTLFVFDDIRWSAEMEQAWEEIKQHPQVTVTVDLFFMGLVFFRKGQTKQHFEVRF